MSAVRTGTVLADTLLAPHRPQWQPIGTQYVSLCFVVYRVMIASKDPTLYVDQNKLLDRCSW